MSDTIKKAKARSAPAGMPTVSEAPAGFSPSLQKADVAGKPAKKPALDPVPKKIPEIGGPSGPEPTRYGDWERKGRCIDF